MKAAVFYSKEDLRINDREIPKAYGDNVLIKVKACGICGTDMHIFDGDEGVAPTPEGTTLGHEFAGEVVEIGERVKGINVGDKVCVDPNKLCNECAFCKEGIGHFCENMVGIGTTVDGGFAEYCLVPMSQVYKFEKDISFTDAAMTEPVACCLHGIDLCNIDVGNTVLVIGGGMIGLIMLQLAKLRGAANLILIEPIKEKREHALKLGANIVIDPINEDVEDVLKANNVDRVNTVIECVGKTSTMEQAIALAGKYSTVMMFGLTSPNDEIKIKPFEFFKKEIILKASFINPYTQARALKLIESKKIDVSSMIYKLITLDKLPSVLDDKKERAKGKFVVCFE